MARGLNQMAPTGMSEKEQKLKAKVDEYTKNANVSGSWLSVTLSNGTPIAAKADEFQSEVRQALTAIPQGSW